MSARNSDIVQTLKQIRELVESVRHKCMPYFKFRNIIDTVLILHFLVNFLSVHIIISCIKVTQNLFYLIAFILHMMFYERIKM